MLELMDHTFDGHEDSLSGDLRGGLGQLVDGVYGWDNFKAAGINGHVKGKNLKKFVLSSAFYILAICQINSSFIKQVYWNVILCKILLILLLFP